MPDEIIQAHSASVSVCEGGRLIGINVFNSENSIIAHCHFDASTAVDFAEDLNDAIGSVITALADGTPN